MPKNYGDINKFVSNQDAIAARNRARRSGAEIDPLDVDVDLQWAEFQSGFGPKPYYDYYYAGEDIKFFIAEIGDDPEFGDVPVVNMQYVAEQQKMPVFGFWNYTYSGVLRGTRLVSGEFSIATKYPNYMKRLLSRAAENRSNNFNNLKDNYVSGSGWRDDDKNIQRYWSKHLDSAALAQHGNEWSIHPPFTIGLVYGIQPSSVDVNGLAGQFDPYDESQALMYDSNQRLVENTGQNSSRVYLDGCELIKMQRAYIPGQIVVENYQFFARDIITP